MNISRQFVKSCCSNSGTYIFFTDIPINKSHVDFFVSHGYIIPSHYVNSGIFYARKNNLVATSTFGSKKINVKIGSENKEERLNEFENLLKTI